MSADDTVANNAAGRAASDRAAAIREIAALATSPQDSEAVDDEQPEARLIPAGYQLHITDPTTFDHRLRVRPRRTTGNVKLQTVGAFVRYVERHDDEASTTLWVDADSRKVVAVFNDHDQAGAGWGDHRAELQLQLTEAWKHWLLYDGKLLEQAQFAQHIEDGIEDIVDPTGALMLEVAQSIEGSTSAEFKRAHRLTDGQVGVEYVETTTAKAGQTGQLDIPDYFTLGLAPFVGEDAYRVGARLRYRIRAGDLMLAYRLDRPADVLRSAVDGIADRLGQQFTLARVFVGTPRSA